MISKRDIKTFLSEVQRKRLIRIVLSNRNCISIISASIIINFWICNEIRNVREKINIRSIMKKKDYYQNFAKPTIIFMRFQTRHVHREMQFSNEVLSLKLSGNVRNRERLRLTSHRAILLTTMKYRCMLLYVRCPSLFITNFSSFNFFLSFKWENFILYRCMSWNLF